MDSFEDPDDRKNALEDTIREITHDSANIKQAVQQAFTELANDPVKRADALERALK